MTMTVLEIVQEFCEGQGLPVPAALVGSSDRSTLQFRAILRAVARDAGSVSWPEQKLRDSFTTVATSDQGLLTDLFSGFSEFIPGTLWIESETFPVNGPLDDQSYAALTALGLEGPPYSYWLRQGHLYLTPVAAAGLTFSAIYRTTYLFKSGATPSEEIATDGDVFLLPDEVVLLGLEAHWRRRKGMSWTAEYSAFEGEISKKRAPNLPTFRLDSCSDGRKPGIFIPPGNWNQP